MAAHRPDGLEVRCDSRAESGPDPWEMAGVLNPPPKNQQPPETSREYMKNMGFSRGFSIYIYTHILGEFRGYFQYYDQLPLWMPRVWKSLMGSSASSTAMKK